MTKAARLHETGRPDLLNIENVAVGRPVAGEVRLRHEAVGRNFADTHFRSGYDPVQPPCGINVECAGMVEAFGEGVTSVAVGDR